MAKDVLAAAEKLEYAIRHGDWVIGAVNFDEDLHFSSYYLRSSLREVAHPLYPGYTRLISFYHGFNERYYLLKEECFQNAKAIVKKAEANVGWLHDVLSRIRAHCENLQRVFDESIDRHYLQGLSDPCLCELYAKHHHAHTELYRWARLPEALDRGVSYFSQYLLQLTREAGVPSSDCPTICAKLTQPVSASILSESIDEFTEMVNKVRKDSALCHIMVNSPRRARMILPYDLVDSFWKYHTKWKCLNYHGYGARGIGDVTDIIQRVTHAAGTLGGTEFIRDRLEANREERDTLLYDLGFDQKHRQLFELYPQIGSVKLYRRYVQLRNFFYLDLLIEEFARRVKCSEWQIRNLLPEEVLASINVGVMPSDAEARCDGCVYCALDGDSFVLSGEIVSRFQHEMQKVTTQQCDQKVLKGVIACRGRVTGTCKIVIRAHDASIRRFEKGEILVSQSTDPDLLNLLKIAGAVLTEEGGVTSHASLICRELGIPAIVGIRGLLDRVSDGDTLEIDAEKGEVRILQTRDDAPSAVVGFADVLRQKSGGKAHGLILLTQIGCRVPPFVILDSEKVRQVLAQDNSIEIDRIKEWVRTRLNLQKAERLAVRSSSVVEDTSETSAAGRFETFLDVNSDALPDALREFLIVNDQRTGDKYCGSVILQRMLYPDFSGVCVTKDSRMSAADMLVIEAMQGSNVLLTKGHTNPARFFVDRKTGDIEINKPADIDVTVGEVDVLSIASLCRQIEDEFGGPVDVEWAFVSNKLYILQARRVIT